MPSSADDVDGFTVGDEVYSMVRFPEMGMEGPLAHGFGLVQPSPR